MVLSPPLAPGSFFCWLVMYTGVGNTLPQTMDKAHSEELLAALRDRLSNWAAEGAYEELQINGRRVRMNLYQLSNYIEQVEKTVYRQPRRRFYIRRCC